MNRKLVVSALALAVLAVGTASAGPPGPTNPATANLDVTLTVANSCTVGTSPVAFGTVYDMTSVNDAQGSVTVTCTGIGGYTVSLGDGLHGAIAQRLMAGPTATNVDYNLYIDSGHTNVWGQTAGTDTVAGTSTGGNTADAPITVYGETAAGQNVPIGDYSDTVLVSVAF
mgnify:CR=1 FL=1